MARKKVITLVLLFVLVLLTGVSIYLFSNLNQETQTTQTRADTYVATGAKGLGIDPCGHIQISVSESPACPLLTRDLDASGKPVSPVTATNSVSEYKTTYYLKNISTQKRTVKYKKMSFFCDEPYGQPTNNGQGGYRPHCIGNPVFTDESVTLEPNAVHSFDIIVKNKSDNKCGSFQSDVVYGSFQTDINIVDVDGNTSCAFPSTEAQQSGSVAAAGLCQTGKSFSQCTAPTQPAVSVTRTPSADTPPSMTIGGPGKTCYEQSKVITVKGDPGSRTDAIKYQVYAIKDNRSEWAAGECPSGQRQGQYCLLGENTQRLFNVDTGTLPIGTYVFFAQVAAPDGTVLCSNDIIKENPVQCSRVCL